jgi:hypothetical protein
LNSLLYLDIKTAPDWVGGVSNFSGAVQMGLLFYAALATLSFFG